MEGNHMIHQDGDVTKTSIWIQLVTGPSEEKSLQAVNLSLCNFL
jgi:hypothetical protein